MENELTNRKIWKSYWENYKFTPVSNRPIYKKYIPVVDPNSSFIEIGGFPGLNAIYFRKHICKKVTILDFYIDPDIIRKIEVQNKIPVGTIRTIEADFFAHQLGQKFDIVFSSGFIEHFQNTKEVIEKHYALLADNGKLLIALPNFRGLNGLIQYLFDRKNLLIHNLKCMNIPFLYKIVQGLGMKDICVEYTRKPMVWLEPKPGFGNKAGRLLTKALSYFIKLFPLKCKLLSPYIVISATK